MNGPIAVIGAGMCGLTCAAALQQAGRRVTVFDKSRGIGGRLATRRVAHPGGDIALDHGAPAAHGEDPAFLGWLAGHGAVVRDGAAMGLPGMSGLLKPVAQGLDIRAGAEVGAVARDRHGWGLRLTDGSPAGRFGAVVLAIPAAQARRLLPKGGPVAAQALDAVIMAPVWALLFVAPTRLEAPDLIVGAGEIARAERQASRPDRPDTPHGPDAWVVQFTPAFSRAHLETPREAVLPLLLGRFAALAGPLPAPVHAAAHRWRFARTEVPLGTAFAGDPAAGLLAGGDWTLGPNAGHAWQSGQAMARALLSA